MTNITTTSSADDRSASCPPWCDGIERHEPLTYTNEFGTYTRTHNRRAGGWLLASYDRVTPEGHAVSGGSCIEWEPAGELEPAWMQKDHLVHLLELVPVAASPTFNDMSAAANSFGMRVADWAILLKGVTFDHPREMRSPNCPTWCRHHGQPHRVRRDFGRDGDGTVSHEWSYRGAKGASVSLERFDYVGEAPSLEVFIDTEKGLSVDEARKLAFAILDACTLAEGGKPAPDDALVLRVAATREWDDVTVERSGGLSSGEAIDYAASALDNARKVLAAQGE